MSRLHFLSEVLALVVLISYACTEVCRQALLLPPVPAHGRAWFGTGGSHSVLVRPVAVVAFKIGVTEFARVFQNRALSGGKPNLMLSRMGGGGGGVPADGLLAKGQPLSGFFALSATIHHWNSGLLRMESED